MATKSSNTARVYQQRSPHPQQPLLHHQAQLPSQSHEHQNRTSPTTATSAPYDSLANYQVYGSPTNTSPYLTSDSYDTYTSTQRTVMANTPLGLADIRPRADSTPSDAVYETAATQNGPNNYMAPWAMYAFDWCKWKPQGNSAGKIATGSYLEDGHNYIQILDTQIGNRGPSRISIEFNRVAEATHSYPVTRLLWEPPSSQKQSTDLLATSGDHLRLWSLPADSQAPQPSSTIGRQGAPPTKLTPLALLSNSKTPEHTAPLTSLDWNTLSPSLIITSSIDTTCTIWDIPSLTAKTQLIAHDKEVYDVRFCANSVDVFVSCGQDGSVRMFDLRSLEHSTIIYEPTIKDERAANGSRPLSPTLAQQTMSHPPPLLRLATSPHDTNLLATFAQDSNIVRILDVRQPGQALLELRGHSGSINCVEWSPTRRGILTTGGDDCQVLVWDLINSAPTYNNGQPSNIRNPVSAWECPYEIGNLSWVPHLASHDGSDWLGVSAGRGIWGVRM
ncbi:hypothetical protein Cpir12675_003112 [Ceratocystis pirilliformis]|uniref:WD repeat-containing protein C17D11.08 n=1 Tax=Ceratocystis pirilliformis TaxID=259994 RepID=A0ABR3Z583_9PEZI